MRLFLLLTMLAEMTLLATMTTPAQAQFGAYTCASGFVWREAYQGDTVCVVPQSRTDAWNDNAQAPARRSPNGGAWGPDTCIQGFVWREAVPQDHVCVFPEIRTRTTGENVQAVFNLASLSGLPQGDFTIDTERHQLGGFIFAQGRASPNGRVSFYAVGSAWRGPFSLGSLNVDPNGSVSRQLIHDARCTLALDGVASIVAVDSKTGLVVTAGPSTAFNC